MTTTTVSWSRALPVALFLLLLSGAYALEMPALVALYLGTAFLMIMLRLDSLHSATDIERVMMGLFVLTLAVVLPLSALRHPSAVGHFVIVLLSLGAAFVMTRDAPAYARASALSLTAVQGAVFAYLAVRGLDNFPLENMIGEQSSNGITSYLIILQVNYSAYQYLVWRRATLVTALLTLTICIIGYGRGSILASAFIVAVNLLSYLRAESAAGALGKVVLGLLLVAVVGGQFSGDIMLFLEANTKIGSGLFDAARERILVDYMAKIDWITAISGAEYDGTSIARDFRDNPHNSFIRAHHIFGLPYLIILALFPLTLLWSPRPLSVKLFCGALLMAMLFRSSTEPVLFPTLFDFYFFAFYFGMMHSSARAPAPAREAAPMELPA